MLQLFVDFPTDKTTSVLDDTETEDESNGKLDEESGGKLDDDSDGDQEGELPRRSKRAPATFRNFTQRAADEVGPREIGDNSLSADYEESEAEEDERGSTGDPDGFGNDSSLEIEIESESGDDSLSADYEESEAEDDERGSAGDPDGFGNDSLPVHEQLPRVSDRETPKHVGSHSRIVLVEAVLVMLLREHFKEKYITKEMMNTHGKTIIQLAVKTMKDKAERIADTWIDKKFGGRAGEVYTLIGEEPCKYYADGLKPVATTSRPFRSSYGGCRRALRR
jgi:hypothetical protein